MKIDTKTILILSLIAVVIALILFRGCDKKQPSSVDVKLIYDSIEQSIISKLPPPDTITVIEKKRSQDGCQAQKSQTRFTRMAGLSTFTMTRQ